MNGYQARKVEEIKKGFLVSNFGKLFSALYGLSPSNPLLVEYLNVFLKTLKDVSYSWKPKERSDTQLQLDEVNIFGSLIFFIHNYYSPSPIFILAI